MSVVRTLWIAALAAASLAGQTIHLKTRNLEPEANPQEYLSQPVLRRTADRSHYLIQFEQPVSAKTFADLRERGIIVTGYLPKSAVMASAPDDFSLQGLPVRWVGRFEWQD